MCRAKDNGSAEKCADNNCTEIRKDIAYRKDPVQCMDAYIPQIPAVEKPVVLLIHGGGFENGDKGQAFYVRMGKAFSERGYVAFSLNYTLVNLKKTTAEKARECAIQDVLAAMAYIRTNAADFHAEGKSFIIQGDSASGAIVAKLAMEKGKTAGIVACIEMWGGMHHGQDGWCNDVYTEEIDPERAVPVLLIHGTDDRVAPYYVSERFKAMLDEKKVPNRLMALPGADHYPEERADVIIQTMFDFLDECGL